ncbi:nucleobase:cation symporter-2 family protein [Paenarthrobacter sp. YAF11_1]|uniref:nucleobase:cation symporter-2 family protein n=1 Tax=Paenarthrobacter sp. YAF11_1 TaxID=3233074 RepID=UPI003F9A3382
MSSKTIPHRRPEDEKLSFGRTLLYGLQHMLTMYGSLIATPLVIAGAAGLSPAESGSLITASLLMGGIATLIQSLGIPFFGSQLPLVQGVSFAGVATMIVIINGGGGLPEIFGAVIAASAIGLVVAPFFAQVVRFFPPVVTGTVITTIGLTLMPVAANWAMGGNAVSTDYGSVDNIGLAGFTLLIVLLLSKAGAGIVSRLSILLAMVLGTIVALILGKTDFSGVGDGPIFAFPMPFAFGAPVFEVAGIIAMLIVVLVTLTETTADILAVGQIVDTKIDRKRIADGLRADMASSIISPIFGSFTQTAFAQNVGLVAITGIKSRYAVAASGGLLVVLGLLPILGRVVAAVPTPVIGGAAVVLFGTIVAAGIRTLSKVDYSNSMNFIVMSASIGFGMIPIVSPGFYDQFPGWFAIIFGSGISSAAILAIALNILFNHVKIGTPPNPSVSARGTEHLAMDHNNELTDKKSEKS